MADPQRRETRRTHLDPSLVPVERAFLARAALVKAEARHLNEAGIDEADSMMAGALTVVAIEFSALAEELHWW